MREAEYTQNQSLAEDQLELPAPHFDARAVAAAHPVEPLPSKHSRSRRSAFLFGAVFFTFVSLAIASIVIILRSSRDVEVTTPTADAQTPAGNVDAVASPEATQAPLVSSPPPAPRAGVRRVFMRHRDNSKPTSTVVIEEQGKPAARKVGVIMYGRPRSSDQPQ